MVHMLVVKAPLLVSSTTMLVVEAPLLGSSTVGAEATADKVPETMLLMLGMVCKFVTRLSTKVPDSTAVLIALLIDDASSASTMIE